MRLRAFCTLLLTAASLWLLPLAGVALEGAAVRDYMSFPPRTQFVPQPAFQWLAFLILSLPAGAAVMLLWAAIAKARPARAGAGPRNNFPWWGWLGLVLLGSSWLLAWHEAFVPAPWRRQLFTPLWLGYILSVNGLAWRRTGTCLLTRRVRCFAALFPASALFWWLFEHLNRFVHNWYYTGTGASDDWGYFAQATLPFCTVLPAIASTWDWLRTFPRLDALSLPATRGHATLAWGALIVGIAALACIGVWPRQLFPALWIGPLLVLGGLQHLLLGESLFSPLQRGDWRACLQPAIAALICGLLWELWNFGSLAKWHYSIPYVQRFQLFEMPLLGYAGYLPFGIECALIIDLVARAVDGRSIWPPSGR